MPLRAALLAAHPAPEGLSRLYALDHGRLLGLRVHGDGAALLEITQSGDTQTLWEGARPENAAAVGSPCGASVALATVGAVDVFDLNDRRRRHSLPLPTAQTVVSRLQWDSPRRLIVRAAEGEVRVWCPHEGALLAAWTAATGEDVTTAGAASPDDPPIFTELRLGPEGWVGRLRHAPDGAALREVSTLSPEPGAVVEAVELGAGRASLDLVAAVTWRLGDTRRSTLHLWRGDEPVALGAVTGPAGADEPPPIWDARLITPGLVFTQGRSGRRVWDVGRATSRTVAKPAGWSRDGRLLHHDEPTVTDPKTYEEARLGDGAAQLRSMSPDGQLVALRRGAELEWWSLTR